MKIRKKISAILQMKRNGNLNLHIMWLECPAKNNNKNANKAENKFSTQKKNIFEKRKNK